MKWIIAILSLVGAISGVVLAIRSTTQKPIPPLIDMPVLNPFSNSISGAGLIEPVSESVIIGVSEAGRVTHVFVKKGQRVKQGDPLFKTDTSALENELYVALAVVKSAEADLERVHAFRRKEDEPLLRARIAQSEADLMLAHLIIDEIKATVVENEANVKDQQARLDRFKATVPSGASPAELLDHARYAVAMATARLDATRVKVQEAQAKEKSAQAFLAQSTAELNTYLAGAWAADVKRADAAVFEARTRVEKLQKDCERRTVRAPLDATVLRLNLREGEYASIGNFSAENAPLVLGNLDVLHVRVDVDEYSASTFKPTMKATLFAKSNREKSLPLKFVAIEPFVIPKRALTNSQRELVDTRVLQVIYKIDLPAQETGLYIGQQVDVFFDRAENVGK
jgi:multidrug efflux pump subunit AcrA (membrane-fusion protein)